MERMNTTQRTETSAQPRSPCLSVRKCVSPLKDSLDRGKLMAKRVRDAACSIEIFDNVRRDQHHKLGTVHSIAVIAEQQRTDAGNLNEIGNARLGAVAIVADQSAQSDCLSV